MAQQPGGPILWWIRRDLRLSDNPALAHAAASGRPVIPVYVLDPELEGRTIGAAACWWLDNSLRALHAQLGSLGSRLVLRSGRSRQALVALARGVKASSIVCNALPEPAARARDLALTDLLTHLDIDLLLFEADSLARPGSLRTGAGGPYKVFTPFMRALRASLIDLNLEPPPATLLSPDEWPASESIDDWRLRPHDPDWASGFCLWTPGETGALVRLQRFLDTSIGDYPQLRDVPGVDGTTGLSAHLHWGEISPRRAIAAAFAAGEASGAVQGAEKLITEIVWREFNRHLLAAFPDMAKQSLDSRFERLAWRHAPPEAAAWREGRTGYPLVDAGMRQLWATGWMHNRVRMVTASFLVKHLLIDWREGEAWFWDTLVDADLANNSANWQWVAGCGADAAPFFRIFNPEAQGVRFDARGAYVRRWIPELARLPDRWIHAPWKAPAPVLEQAGVRLGQTYPEPVVDHAFARARALQAFAALRQPAGVFDELVCDEAY